MAVSYLTLVNQVLIRLRENTVGSVSQTPYSSLIGAFVNDAKREVEDAWQWSVYFDYVAIPITSAAYQYPLNGLSTTIASGTLNGRCRLWKDPTTEEPYVINATNQNIYRMKAHPIVRDFEKLQGSLYATQTNRPTAFSLMPSTSIVEGKWNKTMWLDYTPDQNYTLNAFVCNPPNDLANDTDTVLVPSQCIIQKAYLFSLFERGEEMGEQLTLTQAKIEASLSDAIAFDQAASNDHLQLIVPKGAQY